MRLSYICAHLFMIFCLVACLMTLGTNPALAKILNVKDYGATGLGVADDTAAINKAIKAASIGDTLYFPTGYYLHNSPITFRGLSIDGDGSNLSIITAGDSNNGALIFTGLHPVIKNLTIQYNNPADSKKALASGIYLVDTIDFLVYQTKVQQVSGHAIAVVNGTRGAISSSTITSPTEMSVYVRHCKLA